MHFPNIFTLRRTEVAQQQSTQDRSALFVTGGQEKMSACAKSTAQWCVDNLHIHPLLAVKLVRAFEAENIDITTKKPDLKLAFEIEGMSLDQIADILFVNSISEYQSARALGATHADALLYSDITDLQQKTLFARFISQYGPEPGWDTSPVLGCYHFTGCQGKSKSSKGEDFLALNHSEAESYCQLQELGVGHEKAFRCARQLNPNNIGCYIEIFKNIGHCVNHYDILECMVLDPETLDLVYASLKTKHGSFCQRAAKRIDQGPPSANFRTSLQEVQLNPLAVKEAWNTDGKYCTESWRFRASGQDNRIFHKLKSDGRELGFDTSSWAIIDFPTERLHETEEKYGNENISPTKKLLQFMRTGMSHRTYFSRKFDSYEYHLDHPIVRQFIKLRKFGVTEHTIESLGPDIAEESVDAGIPPSFINARLHALHNQYRSLLLFPSSSSRQQTSFLQFAIKEYGDTLSENLQSAKVNAVSRQQQLAGTVKAFSADNKSNVENLPIAQVIPTPSAPSDYL